MKASLTALSLVLGCVALSSCSGQGAPSGDIAPPGADSERVIDGVDGRTEYFDLDGALADRMARSSVALIENRWLDRATGNLAPDTPSLTARTNLCEDEAFSEQPSAAFCSGVLVDWDLVLTAGHCARAYALSDFSVVFDYYYAAPNTLALTADSVFPPQAIVAEALDDADTSPRYDFAWLRLSHPVGADREPAPLFRNAPPLAADAPLVTIGSPEGVPLKADTSASVADARDAIDYFTAHSDTSAGWSGGGAFDIDLTLLGILSRGGPDLGQSADGCYREIVAGDDEPAAEEFTYAYAALAGLCAAEPARSVCRVDCSEPCSALQGAPSSSARSGAAGCSLSAPRQGEPYSPWALCGLLAAGGLLRRAKKFMGGAHEPRQQAASQACERARPYMPCMDATCRQTPSTHAVYVRCLPADPVHPSSAWTRPSACLRPYMACTGARGSSTQLARGLADQGQ